MGFSESDRPDDTIPAASSLNIRILAYGPEEKYAINRADQSGRQWIDAGLLMGRIFNKGSANLAITYEDLTRQLNISEKFLKKTFVVFRADVVEPLYASDKCSVI